MKRYSSDEINKGDMPCMLWRFVGDELVSPFKVDPAWLDRHGDALNTPARRQVQRNVTAIVEASKAINRMMERPELFGLIEVQDNEH